MKIVRDSNGFLTEEQRSQMYANLPIAVRKPDSEWEIITKDNWLDWLSELEKDDYVHWAKVAIDDRETSKAESVEIPKWIVRDAINALRLNYNNIKEECCLKRQTAQSHNFLTAYFKGETSHDNIKRITVNYIDCRLD